MELIFYTLLLLITPFLTSSLLSTSLHEPNAELDLECLPQSELECLPQEELVCLPQEELVCLHESENESSRVTTPDVMDRYSSQ